MNHITSPQAPFGGEEDYIWHPSGKSVIYVSKRKRELAYATSTNTDLYEYSLDTKQTVNLTEKNLGYDTYPNFFSKRRFNLATNEKRWL